MKESELFEFFHTLGIVPVVKIDDADKAEALAGAMCRGGINCAEVTFRTDAAEEAIRRMTKAYPEMVVGAGTVLNPETAERAVKAGASFIVSPGLDEATVKWCQEHKVPVTPGVCTASEVQKGVNMGLKVLKFFPAESSGGVKMLKDLGGPFTSVKFMTTGGINTENLADYAKASNVLAVGGSWMVKADLINNDKWDEIENLCREAVMKMQGFELAHFGINASGKDDGEAMTKKFSSFGMVPSETSKGYFMDKTIEIMNQNGPGTHGHIGYKVNNIERTMAYVKKLGYTINESSFTYDAKGKVKFFYVNEEIGGFAVHFIQK